MVALPKHETNIISIAKRCPVCRLPVFSARAKYCRPNSSCKQKAYRNRLRQQRNVTPDASLAELQKITQLLEKLLAAGINQNIVASPQTPQNAHHAMPQSTLNDLPELQAKKAKSNGNSRQNLLSAMQNIAGIKKPKPKSNIIAGSDKPLAEPVFDGLEL